MMEQLKRWRRVGGMGLLSAVVLWVGYIAATRWNGRPARPARPATTQPTIDDLIFAFPLDPALDRSEELTAALAALPALPNLAFPPPPADMQWVKWNWALQIQPADALNGPWTPASRPNLQGVIDYLDQPATAAALERLSAIEPGMVRLPAETVYWIEATAELMIARARQQHAERDDFDAALADLAAAYRLGSLLLEAGEVIHLPSGIRCQSAADAEMRRMAFERRLTRKQADRARRTMMEASVAPERIRGIAVDLWYTDTQSVLDSFFTTDGDGNGWLVLSNIENVQQVMAAESRRSGAWNVCSVFFNDRRAVEAKLMRLHEAAENPKSFDRLDAIERAAKDFSLLDGPFANGPALGVSWMTRSLLDQSAGREAALATLAMSAFRTEQDAWPPDLNAMLGTYLEDLPRDPYFDGPLRYQWLAEEDAYLLYSVWTDGMDAGGDSPEGFIYSSGFDLSRDLQFNMTRLPPSFEPKLIEAAP